jgi:hypothetical protein
MVDRDEVSKTVAAFRTDDLLQCVAKLNTVLHNHFTQPDPNLEHVALRDFLSDQLFKKAVLWFKFGNRTTAFFRTQMLSAIRMTMIHGSTNDPIYNSSDHLDVIGELLLKISSLVDRETIPTYISSQRSDASHKLALAAAYRFSFYNHSENLGTSIGRFWAMMTGGMAAARARYPKQYFNLPLEFQRAFGFTVLQMLSQALAIHSHYNRPYRELLEGEVTFLLGEQYFQKVISEDVCRSAHLIFQYLSLPLDAHIRQMRDTVKHDKENPLLLFSIYEHPLVEIDEDAYFPIDLEFLGQRMTDGLYWAMFNHLKSEGKTSDLENLRSSFGHVVEWYVAEILRSTFTSGTDLWLDWDNDLPVQDDLPVPDAIVHDGKYLFFIEVTASALPPGDAVSCDPNRIEDGLSRLWFGGGKDRKSAKILQLQRFIEAFDKEKLQLPGISREDITHKIPILMTLRPLPLLEPLTKWYHDLIRSKGVPESFTNTLELMSLEEMEILAGLKTDGMDWATIFREKHNSVYRFTSVKNYTIFTNRSPVRHPWVDQSLRDAFDSISRLLFNKGFVPPDAS